jgi:hypothetical protein
MPKDREELQGIVEATQRHIQYLRSAGLGSTAKIYEIALLDLQTKLHGISDAELKAFCEVLQQKQPATAENVIDLAARIAGKA